MATGEDVDERVERLERYCEMFWPLLARLAWDRYMEHGRGALLIPTECVDAALDGHPRNTPHRWLGAPIGQAGSEDPFRAAILGYDPEREIVVLAGPSANSNPTAWVDVIALSGVMAFVKTSGSPPPPQCWGREA